MQTAKQRLSNNNFANCHKTRRGPRCHTRKLCFLSFLCPIVFVCITTSLFAHHSTHVIINGFYNFDQILSLIAILRFTSIQHDISSFSISPLSTQSLVFKYIKSFHYTVFTHYLILRDFVTTTWSYNSTWRHPERASHSVIITRIYSPSSRTPYVKYWLVNIGCWPLIFICYDQYSSQYRKTVHNRRLLLWSTAKGDSQFPCGIVWSVLSSYYYWPSLVTESSAAVTDGLIYVERRVVCWW